MSWVVVTLAMFAVLASTVSRAGGPSIDSAIVPYASLQFYPDSMAVGGTTKMVIFIDNAYDSAITGLQFTSNLPPGMAISNSEIVNECGGTLTAAPNGTSFSLSDGAVDPHVTCPIYINVIGTAAGTGFVHTGIISTSNSAPGDDVGANLTVTSDALLAAPSVSMGFAPITFALGGYSQLKVSLTNNDPANAVVGAQFFDSFPAGLASAPNSVVVSNDCSGLVYAENNSLRVFGATIPAGGSCSVIIKVVGASIANGVNQTGVLRSANAQTAQGASAPFSVANAALLMTPSLALTFSPSSPFVGDASDMKFTLTNVDLNGTVNGVQYLQSYPAGVVNADGNPVVGNTCGGSLVAPSGGDSVSLTGAMIGGNTSCDVTIRIKSLWADAFQIYSGVVYSGNAGVAGPTSAALTVNNNPALLNPPAATMTFTPASVGVGETTQMTIALTNPNATAITGARFTDVYPPHMVNAPSGVVVSNNSCGGTVTAPSNGGSAQLSGGTIPPNGCSIVINAAATQVYQDDNHTGSITSSNANPGADASATLIVTYNTYGLLDAPGVVEEFSPSSVPLGDTSQMKITLSNPNASVITGVQFSDIYPSGMVNAASGATISNSCGGNLAMVDGGTSVSLSGGTIPASADCSIVVAVGGSAVGSYDNHTGVVTSANADFSSDASATLTVTDALLAAPTVTKKFAPASVALGEMSSMTITLSNSNGSAITGVSLDDFYPGGMINAPNPIVSDSCNFQEFVPASGTSATLANGTIPTGASCSIVINVIGATVGSFTNDTGPVSSDNAITATGASDTLTVTTPPQLSAPTVTETFVPSSISAGGTSLMTISLSNPNAANAIIGLSLNDIYPAGLVNATGNPVVSDDCNFIEDVPSHGGWVKLSGGTLTAGGQCSISINVIGTATVTNVTGQVSSTNAPLASGATATLTVTGTPLLPAPTAGETFTSSHINVGGTSKMTVTLTNHSSSTITGVELADVYPAGIVNAPGNPVVSDSCNFQENVPPAGSLATLTGGTIPAGDGNTCSIEINVIGTKFGNWINLTGPVLSDNAVSGPTAAATLQVATSLLTLDAPVVSQTFDPGSVLVGGTSSLKILLSNPAANALAITGAHFTNTYSPAHIANAPSGASTDCGGTLTATPGDSSVTLVGGIIPANGACTVEVNVIGISIGNSTSDSGTVTSNNANPGVPATAAIVVTGGALLNAPTVQKSFLPSNIAAGDPTEMTITLTNPNGSVITGVQLDDIYPAGMTNAAGNPVISDSCNFNEDVPAGGSSAKLDGGVVAANDGCSIVIRVVGTSTGTNQTGPVPSGNAHTGNSASATLTVAGTGANHAPIAVGDAIEVLPNGTADTVVGDPNVPGSVLDNDSDLDTGDTLTAVKLSDPAHGTVTLNSAGFFTYQNNGGTTDSFTYQTCDNQGTCSTAATVTITIGIGLNNHVPFAVGDAIEVAHGGTADTLVGDLNTPSSVLDNDTDLDGEPLIATLLADPEHGAATLNANGTFAYQNDVADPATADAFLYEACDPHGACSLATVTISVGAASPNHAPVVVDDAAQVAPGGTVSTLIGDPNVPGSVLSNDSDPDGDPLVASSASGLLNGSGTLTFNVDGSFTYQNDPASPATTDSFLYAACDDRGACTQGTVTIIIDGGPLDQPPTAVDDAIEVAPNGTATILVGGSSSVLTNDTDPDTGETVTLTASLINAPVNGTLALSADGSFVYVNTTPGPDSFQYEACDVHGACNAATVAIAMNGNAPTVSCLLPRQVNMVGDTINLDLSLLFTPPQGQSLAYGGTNLPPSLSVVGSLLTGTFQASDEAGSPWAATLGATTVPGGVSAGESVTFEVFPAREILLRDGFDGDNPPPCQ